MAPRLSGEREGRGRSMHATTIERRDPSMIGIPRLRRHAFGVLAALALALCASGRADAITITEVMYHPAAADEEGVGGRSLEWIEIYNEEPVVEDLSGWYFSNGIDFKFPPRFFLEGRSFVVVCADEQAVRERYGITNTVGDFTGRLDNNGERIELNIFGGGPIVSFRYSDRDQWPQAADGTGHSLVLLDPFLDPDDNDNWARSVIRGGTPGAPSSDDPTVRTTVLIEDDETWRYREGTAPFPAGWRDVGFNDAGWRAGRTGIGYGDGDDRTVLDSMSGSFWSFAARKTFELTAEQIESLAATLDFEIDYDDGFVAWINGREFARGAMGAAGSPVTYTTAAELHEAGAAEAFSLRRDRLRVGTNVLAVEIHNNTLTSSDASFIPRLVSRKQIEPVGGSSSAVVINECFFRTDAGERWLELFNGGSRDADISGFHLSDDRNALDRWTVPQGTVIPPRGHVVFTEAETGLRFTGGDLAFYFSLPDLSEIVDAQVFEMPPADDQTLAGTSDARHPDGGSRFSVTRAPTPAAPNDVRLESDLVINELMYHPPPGSEALEFIELHNRGAEPLDIGGWRFSRGVRYTFPAGTTIPARGFVVVARDPAALEAAHGIGGVHGPYEGALDDSGELVRVVDSLGTIVDQVRYRDGGQWSRWADGGGSSLELLDPRQDNEFAAAWDASDESTKSEWEVVEYTARYTQQQESELQLRMLGPAEVLVDAIELRRGATEHVANGGFESSTSGWRIEGNHIQSRRTTEDAFEGRASLKIVATGDGDTRANRVEADTRTMSSGTYSVRLALRWLRGTNLIYVSGFRQSPEFQHTHWIRRPVNLGSPGARNGRAVDNLGPVIADVRHRPAVPRPGEPTSIRARVSDADGIDSVRAHYRTGSPNGDFSSVELLDDGAHDDLAPNDGVYGGVIPAGGNDVKIVYWVEAIDRLGENGRFPFTARARTLVYQHAATLSARGTTSRLIHDDDAWRELNSRRLHSNELLDATFVFEESRVHYNTGTRYRGSPWNRPGNPRMYRVNFARDDLWRGRRAVNVSRYGRALNEKAAYYSVWQNSTLATPSPKGRSTFTRFRSTAGTWQMELLEPVNKTYLELWFPEDSDGNLMKVTGKQTFGDSDNHLSNLIQWATYRYLGGNKASYRWMYNPRTREDLDEFEPLMDMMRAINATTARIDAELEEIMDVEQFLRVYAARCAHDDWDTISIGNGQNAYVYFAPIEGRWKLLPWDMDHSWGNTSARIYPDADSSFSRVVARPKFRRLYQGILQQMVVGRGGRPGHWNAGEMVTNYLDRIHAVVGRDGVGSPSGIRNFINGRRSQLAAQVPRQMPFAITTNGGDDFARNDVSTTIEGSAWVDVSTILVGEEALRPTWLTTTRWRATVDLEAGENLLEFLAFDVGGRLVGADSVTVTSTIGWASPAIETIAPAAAMPGERITISGVEFHAGIEVRFGSERAEGVEFDESIDPARLTVMVPRLAPATVGVSVRNVDGRSSDAVDFEVLALPPQFVRGDVNLDEVVDLSDVVRLLGHLFRGLPAPCPDAGDADNDESLAVTDAIFLLEFLFRRGVPPPSPHPDQGDDDGEGPLGCPEGLDPLL